jgi:hypothetical protein
MIRLTKESRTRILAAGIVIIATALAIASFPSDTLVVDEIPHIGAGYSYLAKGDFRLNPEHPPLVKDLAGLPLQFMHLDQSVFTTPPWTTDVNGQWQFGRTLIFNSGNNADAIKFAVRLPVLLVFFLSACYLVWRWSYERYGDTAALIAVTLIAFSPTILAHARLVTTDMAAASTVLAATYCFLRFLRAPRPATLALAGATLGLALLAKFNTVLLAPYFVLVAFLYGLDGQWLKSKSWIRGVRHVALTALVGLVAFVGVVWPVYVIQTWNYPIERQVHDTASIMAGQPDNPLKSIALWASDKPIIRGAGHWIFGLAMVAQRAGGGNTIYWLGQVVQSGGPLYFPIVYFLKEPLAWWILVAMGLTSLIFHHRRYKNEPKTGSWWSHNTEEWVWVLWLAIYWGVSMHSTLNIGIRHLLPVFPFMIMFISGRLSVLIDWLQIHDRRRAQAVSLVIAILLGWYAFESVRVFPYYLTYFNQIAGGPAGGYRYVADSNLDWGQDLKRLGEWTTDHSIKHISLDYFGWSDPAYYLKDRVIWTTVSRWKDANDFIRRNQSEGWIAISGTFLQQATYQKNSDNGGYRWLLNYEPEAVIGNSIFVYHIVN